MNALGSGKKLLLVLLFLGVVFVIDSIMNSGKTATFNPLPAVNPPSSQTTNLNSPNYTATPTPMQIQSIRRIRGSEDNGNGFFDN